MVEKLEFIKETEGGKPLTQVSKDECIPKSTLGTWLKGKEKIMEAFSKGKVNVKRDRQACNQRVDEALLIWFKQIRSHNTAVDGELLLTIANSLAQSIGDGDASEISKSWVERWKKRHGIGQATVSGECASVNDDVVKRWRENVLPDLLKRYKPEGIYNMDETGLFYRMQTDKTLHFKGTKCSGGKQGKERMTLALTANMDGSHTLTPLAIGKFAKPRCFKNVTSLPVDYKSNTKA